MVWPISQDVGLPLLSTNIQLFSSHGYGPTAARRGPTSARESPAVPATTVRKPFILNTKQNIHIRLAEAISFPEILSMVRFEINLCT